jgi:hypothetical protein
LLWVGCGHSAVAERPQAIIAQTRRYNGGFGGIGTVISVPTILDDNSPTSDHQSTTQHFARQLENSGLSWKAYEEDIGGTDCPLTDIGGYAVRHNPFVYFDDMTDAESTTSAYCIAHVRPYAELTGDLQQNQVARYNFITPNLCHDMHDCSVASLFAQTQPPLAPTDLRIVR